MNRREFITLLGGAAAAGPIAARAQQAPERMRRIGIIDDAPMWNAFRQGLRDHGYLEGQNIAFDYKYADGAPERLAEAASELVRRPVDVIATYGTPPSRAAKEATATIPIVMIAIGDPVRAGLVASIARPGGCHREHHPWPGGRRQAVATLQGGRSHHLTHGLSRESG